MNVRIGIHVHADPRYLQATLAAVRANTGQPVDVVLLLDGPDDETRAALARLSDVSQLALDTRAAGGAAAFNALVGTAEADVYILLESGALPGPGWLEPLLAALAEPQGGLAGPSTNRSWNEQRLFPGTGGTPAEVAAVARVAGQRYAGQRRTLEPLYSLADFCYAVRHDVVTAIGGADVRYGRGPCWEMDYNIRAARAGFKGVWALDSYVYRSPFTLQRQRDEAAAFEASKRLYQDKFCGLRLRGEKGPYEAHCRGAACVHFAPVGLVELKVGVAPVVAPTELAPTQTELAPTQTALAPTPTELGPTLLAAPTPLAAPTVQAAPTVAATATSASVPRISCIMPTRGRPEFVRQAIGYFLRQDYAERELVIVYEAEGDLPRPLHADPRIITVQAAVRSSIGAKRNAGIRSATGELLAQWDDDDWYADTRLSRQAAPLLAGAADITALEAGVFFDLDGWAFWRITPELHRRLFVGDVHGGTLVFRRSVWERLGRYPDGSLAEDALFLRTAQRGGARLLKLANDDQFVYLRHAANAWAFPLGRYLDPAGWLRTTEPPFPPADREFYVRMRAPAEVSPAEPAAVSPAALAPAAPASAAAHSNEPLVSCIMPTYNRPHYVGQAIKYFLRQDYPHRELLILDDGEQSAAAAVAQWAAGDPRIRYVRLPHRMVLGAKRNRAVELAAGELIAHWDDDDWMAPRRLSLQVRTLLAAGADLCGAPKQFYYDPLRDEAWLYQYLGGRQRYVAGNTLVYRRTLWQANPFPEVQVGEDTRFIWSPAARALTATREWDYYVGLLHPSNTSPKSLNPPHWTRCPVEEVRRMMGEDVGFYWRET